MSKQFVEGVHYTVRPEDSMRVLRLTYVHRSLKELEEWPEITYVDAEGKPRINLKNGVLMLLLGFLWDGASGPTRDSLGDKKTGRFSWLRNRFASFARTWGFEGRATNARASAFHDAGYVITRKILGPYDPGLKTQKKLYKMFQKIWDTEFRNILQEDGMSRVRRNYWYYAVRWFGFKHITGRAK